MLSKAFWVVMAIHLTVFTCLGLFSDRGWGLLLTFVGLLIPTLLIKWLLAGYARRHPEKKKLNNFLNLK